MPLQRVDAFRVAFDLDYAATLSNSEWSDRKSTRLNSSHLVISYAVFCLKKKKNTKRTPKCGSSRPAKPAVPVHTSLLGHDGCCDTQAPHLSHTPNDASGRTPTSGSHPSP